MSNKVETLQYNRLLHSELTIARDAITMLNALDVRVIAVMANGRRPLLMIDHIPDSFPSALKRKHPNGFGGSTIVLAAEAYGCQLEAMHDEYPDGTVISAGADMPRAQVAHG